MSQVTVVVPAYGDAERVVPLLDVLDAQAAAAGVRVRVVVSDDASPVPLEPALTATGRANVELRCVRADRNGGPGAARNVGLAAVETPWVAFMDADVVPEAGWLDRLLAATSAPDAPDGIEGRVVVRGGGEATPFTHATEIAPPAQRGAGNLVLRTEVLRGVGGFDERFYDPTRSLHFREDAELAFRLEASGAVLAYDPELVAAHPPLPPSLWGPVRLARRYHFDPLLDRLHPDAFRAMNDLRKVGPVSLRKARHLAADAVVAGAVVAVAGAVARRQPVRDAGAGLLLVGWLANAVALSWRRKVRPRHLAPLAAVSAVVPWVYLWHHWRGVLAFRHRPRL